MPNNQQNQKTRKGPRPLTPEEIQMLKAQREVHLKKLETDPEYRKKWKKIQADTERIGLFNDSIETTK